MSRPHSKRNSGPLGWVAVPELVAGAGPEPLGDGVVPQLGMVPEPGVLVTLITLVVGVTAVPAVT